MTTGNTARIRNLVETARSAINENNHDTEDVDQEDFASVVSATFRDFRRRRQPDLRQTKRGRKASSIWKARVFLLKRSNVDFLPSIAECKYLDDNGYGSPKKQDGTATILMVNRSWPLEQFKLFLCEQYPQMSLGVVGFKLAKCDKGKKIKILETSSSVRVIEKAVGRGKLLLIPDQYLVFQPSDSGTPTIAFRSQRAASVLSVSSPANDHQSAVVETPPNEQPLTIAGG
ncbi:uncharacterized protein [Apostichopus japonicus]|uniref:uncharacterized protein isoform X2 n=1 Tax=Stichopus japonicus TaxID=307972 RepID=UPI003AB69D91